MRGHEIASSTVRVTARTPVAEAAVFRDGAPAGADSSADTVRDGILARIGGTPLVRLRRLVGSGPGSGTGSADVFAKCEHLNPGGSVKDRAALAMIEDAERQGRLIPGRSVIVEATSGNTGIGLALVAAVKGYRLILTMPDNMSAARQALLRSYGAELHLTPALRAMQGAVDRAQALAARRSHAFMPRQFSNPANPDAHLRTTGPEILAALAGRAPDVLVAGVGTGGTITGVGRALRAHHPNLTIVAVEPATSAVLSGGAPGPHAIQGIGAGFVPEIFDRRLVTEVRCVADDEALAWQQALARHEGLFVGVSSGAAAKIAADIARELGPGRTVVTIFPDTGERYVGG